LNIFYKKARKFSNLIAKTCLANHRKLGYCRQIKCMDKSLSRNYFEYTFKKPVSVYMEKSMIYIKLSLKLYDNKLSYANNKNINIE